MLYKFENKNISIFGCSRCIGLRLFNTFNDGDFHRFNSHGGWVEFNKITYFVVVKCVGRTDNIKIRCMGKSMSKKERLSYRHNDWHIVR